MIKIVSKCNTIFEHDPVFLSSVKE